MASGDKPVRQEFNLVDEVLLMSGEGAMSMNHTNSGASKNARCMEACGRKAKATVLSFFKNFSDDASGRDGHS